MSKTSWGSARGGFGCASLSDEGDLDFLAVRFLPKGDLSVALLGDPVFARRELFAARLELERES